MLKDKNRYNLIKAGFLILSAWLTLQTDLDNLIHKFMVNHKFDQHIGLRNLLVSFAIAVMALIFLFIEGILWKYFGGYNRNGWWVYGLVDDEETTVNNSEEGAKPIVGYFYVDHKPNEITVSRAHCFYYDEKNVSLIKRGDWQSNKVWVSKKAIQLVYDMRADEVHENMFMPRTYIGFMQLDANSENGISGTDVHNGFVVAVTDEHNHGGYMYCERIKKAWFFWRGKAKYAEQVLEENAYELVDKAKKFRKQRICVRTQ
ncbi:MAG: hypothetical protein HY096_00690 [Nitrospinae bacterium]|nr:hypothetical protein [Nitrospinota bacterium]